MAILLYFHFLFQLLLTQPAHQEPAFYFNQPFTLQQHESVVLTDSATTITGTLKLSLNYILDSRCPQDVLCIQAGTAELRLTASTLTGESIAITVATGGGNAQHIQPQTIQGSKFTLAGNSYAVRLLNLAPYPVAKVIQPPKYARLLVVKL